MPTQMSHSLLLIWKIAELEARNLRAEHLEPSHFLLSLAKVVDVDLVSLLDSKSADRDAVLEEFLRETRKLRETFQMAGLDPKAFRRCYRKLYLESNIAAISPEVLHRSTRSRQAFRSAVKLASGMGRPVSPLYLLIAVLELEDKERDALLGRMESGTKMLIAAARRHCVAPSQPPREVGMN